MFKELPDFFTWFAHRRAASTHEVVLTRIDQLAGWLTEPDTGNLCHATGRFFSVEGVAVATDHREVPAWTQPIILQPEIGILGILVKRFDGVPHCLMQVKMEPGNINGLQLSPTVQATLSNYTRVHEGRSVPYLHHFLAAGARRAVFDVLQSEQGSWFLDKRNRNMIVETDEDVPVAEDFCWLTVDQLRQLLLVDNMVNMDSRSVMSGLRFLTKQVPASDGEAMHSTAEVLSWFTEQKASHRLDRRIVPLSRIAGWERRPDRVTHQHGLYFDIVGVHVQTGSREVARWSQPMLAPVAPGIVAFIAKRIKDRPHLLVAARTEAGTHDVVEMSATVNCCPENYRRLDSARQPRFLDYVLSAPPEHRLADVVHSEEGGRFYHAENRYLVVAADDDFPIDVPDDFIWMTADQLADFARYGNHVHVSARTLLALTEALTEWKGR